MQNLLKRECEAHIHADFQHRFVLFKFAKASFKSALAMNIISDMSAFPKDVCIDIRGQGLERPDRDVSVFEPADDYAAVRAVEIEHGVGLALKHAPVIQ